MATSRSESQLDLVTNEGGNATPVVEKTDLPLLFKDGIDTKTIAGHVDENNENEAVKNTTRLLLP